MNKSTSSGRKLIGPMQLPRFTLIISPIIITFVLMFSGGHGYSIAPGALWFACLCLAQVGLFFIKKSSLSKDRSPMERMKLMDYSCGIFMGFDDNLGLLKQFSERIVFHAFTIVYLAIHLFAPNMFNTETNRLSDANMIFPSIFWGVIVLFGIGDIIRMKMKCFSNLREVFISLFIGGIIGLLTSFIGLGIGKTAIFFNNMDKPPIALQKCKN